MKVLRIVKAKPNPAGKDRVGGFASKKQLAAEWVDFQNIGDESFGLQGVSLQHIAYQPPCRDGKWAWLMSFTGALNPGEVIRVHSGSEIPLYEMYPEDATGATYHFFTGHGFVWNNDCGDTAGLWNGLIWVDTASYDPYPVEGKILVRQGDKLI